MHVSQRPSPPLWIALLCKFHVIKPFNQFRMHINSLIICFLCFSSLIPKDIRSFSALKHLWATGKLNILIQASLHKMSIDDLNKVIGGCRKATLHFSPRLEHNLPSVEELICPQLFCPYECGMYAVIFWFCTYCRRWMYLVRLPIYFANSMPKPNKSVLSSSPICTGSWEIIYHLMSAPRHNYI